MQKKVLVSSILVIALCLSVIAGSTFALFTDKKSTNIAITSGDVEVKATLEITGLYSAQALADQTADTTKYLEDEDHHKYTHVKSTDGYFLNGGTAKLVNSTNIEITNITPGDRVDANIVVANVGNVDMIYRYIITAKNTKLAEGMVVTAEGTPYEAVKEFVSPWSAVVEPDANNLIKHGVSFQLPVYAGDEYQSEVTGTDAANPKPQSVTYTITVEAVQGNAIVDDAISAYDKIINVANMDELKLALQNVDHAYTINFTNDIIGNVEVPQRPDVKYTLDGNGYELKGAITVNGASAGRENSALVVKNIDFVADSKAALGMDAFINLGKAGTTAARYTNNVTIEGCTFTENLSGKGIAAVKSYTGGDEDLVITGCTVNAGMHSFIQVKNIETGFVIDNCTSYAKNGINVNNTYGLEVKDSTIIAEGYAFRCGENVAPTSAAAYQEIFTFSNCTLKVTNPAADDAVLVFRGNSINAKVTLIDTTIEGVESYGVVAGTTIIDKITNP